MRSPRSQASALVLLVLLIGALGYIVYERGFGLRLGGAPATLQGPFATEEAWIVNDIARDIIEMSAYPDPKPATVAVSPSADAGVYAISIGNASGPVTLDLRQELWSPAQFAALARAALTGTGGPPPGAGAPIHSALLEPTPAAMIAANAAISKALAANMRDARAHDAAALLLGAFALRDSAGRFSDPRWAMNRMTAHLAIAAATRQAGEAGVDGELAAIILLAFTDQQTRALEAIARLPADSAAAAWARALRLRITQDVRNSPSPATGPLLERREYFRAWRATVPSTASDIELDRLAITPEVDVFRMIEVSGLGVEDGGRIVDRILGAELAEAGDVFARMHGHPMEQPPAAPLNARTTRTIGEAGPIVLPWGAWAEFAQRHLAMFVGKSDNHYRHIIGDEKQADTDKQRLKSALGHLTMFPLATIFWTKGVSGGDADLGLINEAIAMASAAPERVPAPAWAFLAAGSHYEPVRRGFPEAGGWFIAPGRRAGYEAALRLKEINRGVAVPAIADLLKDAPYDGALAAEYLKIKYGEKPPSAEVRKAYGPRLEYDLRALRAARTLVGDDDAERMRLAKTSCEVSAGECIALGRELANADRPSEAAASYERAFADPSLDAIALSNASAWLVTYYYRHGRTAAALALAERSGGTGSWQGLNTLAYLYERLGRVEEAEEHFKSAADGYDNLAQLLGFYYRAVILRKQMQFDPAWKTALARVFPDGLATVTTSAAKPSHGVVVVKDSTRSRAAGLQADDIIVGLEGWRVDNLQQYNAVNAFFERDQISLTAWRGHLFQVAASTPNRLFGTELRTYPISGWRERP